MKGSSSDVHVLPINDLRVHEETRTCWCEPTPIRGLATDRMPNGRHDTVIVHHSADGRELVEEHGVN